MDAQQQQVNAQKCQRCECRYDITALSNYHLSEHRRRKRHRQALAASNTSCMDTFFAKLATKPETMPETTCSTLPDVNSTQEPSFISLDADHATSLDSGSGKPHSPASYVGRKSRHPRWDSMWATTGSMVSACSTLVGSLCVCYVSVCVCVCVVLFCEPSLLCSMYWRWLLGRKRHGARRPSRRSLPPSCITSTRRHARLYQYWWLLS